MGTQNYWQTMLTDYVMTDGVLAVCEAANCFWLVDAILSHQATGSVHIEYSQFWTLSSLKPQDTSEEGVLLTCTDGDKGSGPVTLAQQEIEYSDFPRELLPFEIWISNKVLLLPDEY
jgi:hypothetical protein